jgi:SSS family solute:Na+ symporter/sodium/pantothenate symporter
VSFKPVKPEEGAKQLSIRSAAEDRLRELDAALLSYSQSNSNRLPDSLDVLPNAVQLATDPVTGKRLTYVGAERLRRPAKSARRELVAITPPDDAMWRSCLYSNGMIRSGLASNPGDLITGPGPYPWEPFQPLALAFSFFFMWVVNGLASPAGMVRVIAAKSTETVRRSIYVLATYNTFIYLPLILICICGRVLIPDLPAKHSDEIIPRLAMQTTEHLWGGSFVAGLILAAPFGAVMATVSSYLVVISSGLVRDIYQRFINPHATVGELKRLSYVTMVLVGVVAVIANIRPVEYLQAIVVFCGSGGAVAFLIPALMACYWRRATAAGVFAGMFLGTSVLLLLYGVRWVQGSFRPYLLFGLEPLVWGIAASLVASVTVSLLTEPPDEEHVSSCFDVERP